MGKNKGHGRSAFANKKQGFYLSPKKKDNDTTTKSNANSMAKGVSMKNSNVSHRTCQG